MAAREWQAQRDGSMLLSRRALWPFAAILLAAAIWLRLQYSVHSRLAVDEFEHVHAAWLVSQGQRPYVDFFEHHPPLVYYAAALPLRFLTPSFDALIQLRLAAFAAWLATCVLLLALVRRTASREAAVATGVFLLMNTLLFQVGARFYLDTFAAPFLALTAFMLSASPLRMRDVFVATFALGIAGLITQKVAVVIPAFVIVLIAAAWRRGDDGRRAWGIVIAGVVAGAVASAALVALPLRGDGLLAFWRDAILLNAGWKARHFPFTELNQLLRHNGFVFALALTGLAVTAQDALRRDHPPWSRAIAALFLASLTLGVFLLPVVWEEYFALLVPFLCAVAGVAIVRIADAPARWSIERAGVALGLLLAVAAGAWRLSLSPAPLAVWAAVVIVASWLALAWRLVPALRHRKALRWPWLVLPALAYSLIVQVETTTESRNDDQRERVEFVLRASGPNEPYFDGYSGYGVFRPHAYRYWFLHDEIQLMLGEEVMTTGVLAALRERKPRFVTYDAWTETLPPDVLEYLRRNYRETAFRDIWMRVQRD